MKTLALLLLLAITSGTTTVSEKIQKSWKLNTIEEFGEKWAVGDKNKNDALQFNKDATFSMILYGEEKNGKWSFNENAKTINFKTNNGSLYFKFISVTDSTLIVEYQQPSLIRSKLHYQLAN